MERLAQTANRISGGEYSLRTRIDSGDEIGSLSKSFDAMVAELEQQLENRTAFVADFSHELKTPMTSVIGYADILRTHVLESMTSSCMRTEFLKTQSEWKTFR